MGGIDVAGQASDAYRAVKEKRTARCTKAAGQQLSLDSLKVLLALLCVPVVTCCWQRG